MDDLQAIQRLKRGDPGGLEQLITHYQVRATRAAFLITHDAAAAEDVVQETFLRIHDRISQFDESLPFEPYLMRSIVHAALNAVRGQARALRLDDDEHELKELLDRAVSVESQVEYSQLQQEILAALGKLPPRQRAVIVQRYFLQMSEKEMAQVSATAPGTVKWLLHAARERLQQLLGQKGASHE